MQILQIDNTSEEEGSLQCSSLVLHQWRFKNEKGPCYAFLVMSYCVTRTYLKDFTTWFPLSRIDFWEYESTRIESIRQNFSPPCAFIRDLTSGKSSSAKRTSGESEVFDPRADSNRLCFKTIRLSLGVLDMSEIIGRKNANAADFRARLLAFLTRPFPSKRRDCSQTTVALKCKD